MVQKVLIFGITDLAELLFSYIESDPNYNVLGFVVDHQFQEKKEFCGKEVYTFENIDDNFSPTLVSFFVCVGYTKMNTVREHVFKRIKDKKYSILSYFHPSSIVLSSSLGEGNLVFPNVMLDKFTTIADGNVFYPESLLAHHSSVGSFNFFAVKSCVCGHVKVKNNCFIGANSTIKNGVELNAYTLVGGGTYINKDTDSYGVYVPAMSVKLTKKSSIEIHL